MQNFVHLHGHSQYSLLDGLCKIPKLVKKAKELNMEALALTDHGVMYGAIEFYKACVSEGVKPIIGCELYLAPRSHKDKEGKVDSEPYHLIVLAKNLEGYRNLMKLVSISHLEGFYYKPRVDKELLKKYSEGLIALSGCPSGELMRSIDSKDLKKAEEVAKTYLDIFGQENYYFELQYHPYEKFIADTDEEIIKRDLEKLNTLQIQSKQTLKELSKKLGVKIVATNDFHYIEKDDAFIQDTLLCVQTGKFLKDINRLRMIDTPDFYLKSYDEMKQGFVDMPECLEESVKIASKIDLSLELGKSYLPVFKTPDNLSADEYLKTLTYLGAKDKKLEMSSEVKDRLEYELDIITHKKFSNYFLIVTDFMNWAHQNGIITNTRGSAAGSLVLYCLGVTNLNPLDYLIPFERFLTKFRPTLPDIDADLADDRRDEVISYVMSKYGKDRVAHIVTFGTMMGRAAIRDVGRVMGLSYSDVDKIAKLVPPPHQGFHKPLSLAIKEVSELSEIYKNNPEAKQLLDTAVKIEGTVRHASVHAAGIVISPDEITHFTPLQKESNGDKIVCQYDMFSIMDEYGGAGLVKMDFLGIRNLSILGRAVEYVKRDRGIDIDLNSIPLDDKATFEILSRGETMGVFQLSSAGMTKNLIDLKPTRIQDLSAMVALYRPGPMGIIPEYIQRKHNPKQVKYYDPRMKEYLEQSLGLLVYQDDVLLTAINVAGYSWEEADKFRKAMGKKIPAEMAKQKDKFIQGSIKNGLSQEKAQGLFDLIAPFAAYGFNKAHAASYAMVAYQTAYMKANFPVEFMAAVMTAEYGDSDKIAEAIEECKKMRIPVLPPDIRYSKIGFTLQLNNVEVPEINQGIRFGLSAIKNVGMGAIESIIKAREEEPFKNLYDITHRVDTRLVNRKTLESLIKAGALDCFGGRSAQLLSLDKSLEDAHKASKSKMDGQTSLFDSTLLGNESDSLSQKKFELPEVEEMPLEQLLIFEKDLLGFYLHEPMYLKNLQLIKDIIPLKISQIDDSFLNQKVIIGGVISSMKKVFTKKDAREMAFITIFDGTKKIEAVVFPKLFTEKKIVLQKEEVVILNGRIDKREEEYALVLDNIEKFDPDNPPVVEYDTKKNSKELEIELPKSTSSELLKQINLTLRKYPGVSPISLLIPSGNNLKKMDLSFRVNPNSEMISNIEQILGQGSVRVV